MRSTLLAIALTIAGLIASHYFYGNFRYDSGHRDGVSSVSQDSVKIDTVFVEVPVIEYEWIVVKEAEVDTVNDASNDLMTYSTSLDSTFVIDKDTVAVLKQDISFTEGMFEILTNIEIRPIEKIITVTNTVYQTAIKEVAVSKFPNTFLTGFISAVVLVFAIIVALL